MEAGDHYSVFAKVRSDGVAVCHACCADLDSIQMPPCREEAEDEIYNFVKGREMLRAGASPEDVQKEAGWEPEEIRRRMCNVFPTHDKFFLRLKRRCCAIQDNVRFVLEVGVLRDLGSCHKMQALLYDSAIDLAIVAQKDFVAFVESSYVKSRPNVAYEKRWSEARISRSWQFLMKSRKLKDFEDVALQADIPPFAKQLLLEDVSYLVLMNILTSTTWDALSHLANVVITPSRVAKDNKLGSQRSLRWLVSLEEWADFERVVQTQQKLANVTAATATAAALADFFGRWSRCVSNATNRLIAEGLLERGLYLCEKQKLACEYRKWKTGTLIYTAEQAGDDDADPNCKREFFATSPKAA